MHFSDLRFSVEVDLLVRAADTHMRQPLALSWSNQHDAVFFPLIDGPPHWGKLATTRGIQTVLRPGRQVHHETCFSNWPVNVGLNLGRSFLSLRRLANSRCPGFFPVRDPIQFFAAFSGDQRASGRVQGCVCCRPRGANAG